MESSQNDEESSRISDAPPQPGGVKRVKIKSIKIGSRNRLSKEESLGKTK